MRVNDDGFMVLLKTEQENGIVKGSSRQRHCSDNQHYGEMGNKISHEFFEVIEMAEIPSSSPTKM